MTYPKILDQIDTPNGKGIVVEIHVPFNGLYYEPERMSILVWFGTDAWVGCVSERFTLKELSIGEDNNLYCGA